VPINESNHLEAYPLNGGGKKTDEIPAKNIQKPGG